MEINEEAHEQTLSVAVTCTILATTGPRRSRVLPTLYKVVVDVGVSKEEICFGMVEDVVHKYGVPFNKQNKGVKEKLIRVVEEQTRVISDMQSSIHDLRKLVEAKN
ncbi:COP9 signalosome complex subunit 4 [Vigna angularis]|uniref:COP9 signalosome complex subunit 4 n=1 Tax=Phaseolus angularis TaxID=3914 RepID=A0A8T0JF86_PHAAN|nr:COP9 signalosome complex subunit 4 [Vigna angularis]